MDAARRRELMAMGQRMKARLTAPGGALSDNVIEHIRQAFTRAELLKVRVNTTDRAEAETAGAELAQRIPCEVLDRRGFVLLLYREP